LERLIDFTVASAQIILRKRATQVEYDYFIDLDRNTIKFLDAQDV
jgi:hypothetical protein